MKANPLLVASFLLASTSLFSQNVVYENSNNNLLSLNPSFAGSNGGQRFQYTVRSQWPNPSPVFLTHNLAYDAKIQGLKAGLGIEFQRDNYAGGTLIDNRLGFCFSKYIYSRNKKLLVVPSFEVQYIYKVLDPTRILVGGLIDGRLGRGYPGVGLLLTRRLALSGSAGILIRKGNLSAGFSVKNFNRPEIGMTESDRVSALFITHVSYTKQITRYSSIQLFGAQTMQGGFIDRQLRLCAYLNNFLEIGTAFHNYDFYDIIVGFRNSTLAINYTYSSRFGVLRIEGYDVHNVGLSYSFGKKSNSNTSLNLETW